MSDRQLWAVRLLDKRTKEAIGYIGDAADVGVLQYARLFTSYWHADIRRTDVTCAPIRVRIVEAN